MNIQMQWGSAFGEFILSFIFGSLAIGEESDAMVKITKNLPKKTVDQMKLSEYLWEIREMRYLIEAFIPDKLFLF